MYVTTFSYHLPASLSLSVYGGAENARLELNGPNQQTPRQCRWLCTLIVRWTTAPDSGGTSEPIRLHKAPAKRYNRQHVGHAARPERNRHPPCETKCASKPASSASNLALTHGWSFSRRCATVLALTRRRFSGPLTPVTTTLPTTLSDAVDHDDASSSPMSAASPDDAAQSLYACAWGRLTSKVKLNSNPHCSGSARPPFGPSRANYCGWFP